MNKIEDLLKLPLGDCLAEGNWESHVYELGNAWVYKEIRQADSIDEEVSNYESRQLLQKFWNSGVHFKNMVNDYQVFKSKLGDFIPETFFIRQASLLDKSNVVSISIQEKLRGTLLKDIRDDVPQFMDMSMTVVINLAVNTTKLIQFIF